MNNLATILPLKFKLPTKFQRFNGIAGSIQMLQTVIFETISIKMKTFQKKFQNMQPGAKERVALRTLFSPHQIKASYFSGTNLSRLFSNPW